MMTGRNPGMDCQYGFSVALALIAGGLLSTQDAGNAVFTRIVPTLARAFVAALGIALLAGLAGWRGERLMRAAP